MSARTNLPFLVAIAIIGAATIFAAAVQLFERLPLSPWEPAIAMEAVRFNSGLPVYETEHATHMYGPLLTVLFAGVFRIFGLNFIAARIVMSIFAIGCTILTTAILCRAKGRDCWLLAVFLFLGINFRTNLVFFSMQPDCAAAFLAISALYLWSAQTKSPLRCLASISLFICAVLFKQTSAAFALIPVAHILTWKRPLQLRLIAFTLIPAMSILLVLALIRAFWPQMFVAMVTVPASIKVYPERALNIALYLLTTFPIFLIAVFSIFRRRTLLDDRDRWLISAIIVLLPIGVWTMCKAGSDYNSLLFAYLAMTALFVARLDAIMNWLRSMPILRGVLASSAIALLILFSLFCQAGKVSSLLFARGGDDKRAAAIRLARRLDGVVMTPQDPTIAYRAKNYFGCSLFFELDAHAVNGNWPDELPMSILREISRARYVMTVHSYVPTPVFERGLLRNNFRPVEVASLADSAYTLWMKE